MTGSSTAWVVVATVPPWPVVGGVQTKLAGLLESAPRPVDVVVPAECESPSHVTTHVVRPARRWRRLVGLARGRMPSQTRLDSRRIEDTVLRLAEGHDQCVVHLDTVATAHLAGRLRRRLGEAGITPYVISSLNDSYSFLRQENPRRTPVLAGLEVWAAKQVERRQLPAADVVDVVSQADAGWLACVVPDAHVRVLSLGVRPEWRPPDVAPAREVDLLLFSGNAGLIPFLGVGVDAVRAALPDTVVSMVGPRPAAEVQRLLDQQGIRYLGLVDDVAAAVAGARVMLAPSQQRCGLSNRAMLAMRVGTPVVGGRCLQTLPGSVPGRDYLVGLDPAGQADAVVRLLEDPSLVDSVTRSAARLMSTMPTVAAVAAVYWDRHTRAVGP